MFARFRRTAEPVPALPVSHVRSVSPQLVEEGDAERRQHIAGLFDDRGELVPVGELPG